MLLAQALLRGRRRPQWPHRRREAMTKWTRFSCDTRGATMVEYIVLVALIFLASLAAWKKLGENANLKVEKARDALAP